MKACWSMGDRHEPNLTNRRNKNIEIKNEIAVLQCTRTATGGAIKYVVPLQTDLLCKKNV